MLNDNEQGYFTKDEVLREHTNLAGVEGVHTD